MNCTKRRLSKGEGTALGLLSTSKVLQHAIVEGQSCHLDLLRRGRVNDLNAEKVIRECHQKEEYLPLQEAREIINPAIQGRSAGQGNSEADETERHNCL